MGIDWDKPLRTKETHRAVHDIARWKNGAPARHPTTDFFLCEFDDGETVHVDISGIENAPERYWLVSDPDYSRGCRVNALNGLSESWSTQSSCIELEPVTNGPDRVVQTILLGDAE